MDDPNGTGHLRYGFRPLFGEGRAAVFRCCIRGGGSRIQQFDVVSFCASDEMKPSGTVECSASDQFMGALVLLAPYGLTRDESVALFRDTFETPQFPPRPSERLSVETLEYRQVHTGRRKIGAGGASETPEETQSQEESPQTQEEVEDSGSESEPDGSTAAPTDQEDESNSVGSVTSGAEEGSQSVAETETVDTDQSASSDDLSSHSSDEETLP